MKPWLVLLLVAAGATAAVLVSLGPDCGGPGVTCDELYHVGLMGKPLVTAVRHQGLAFLAPANIRRNFAWPRNGPPVQAPLGHWILGATHYLFDPAPDNPAVVSLRAARVAPALAFGLLVFLVGHWTWRREGSLAGLVAAFCVLLMPRLFAHAHFAALDMLTTTACVAALFSVAWAARLPEGAGASRPLHGCGRFALAGVVWGMAMLIRLHGALLVFPMALWLFWRVTGLELLRRGAGRCSPRPTCRSTGPLIWFAAGLTTLWVGWPWLWLNPVANSWRYLTSGAERHAVHVFYLGHVWADHEAPWHYPLLMFAWTVPVGFLALGAAGIGVWCRRAQWGPSVPPEDSVGGRDFSLIALAGLFMLAVFAWPGVPVYDGVRLFLIAFPLWAIFAGLGAKWLTRCPIVARVPIAVRVGAVALFVALQAVGVVIYHPSCTSYYSFLVGGLPGAERMGLETTYWGDSVVEPLLVESARRAPEQPVLFGPHLAPFQAPAVEMSSPALAASETALVGWDSSRPDCAEGCNYALVYRRRADLAAVDWILEEGRVVAEYGKQGVWLARLMTMPRRVPPRRAEPRD